MVIIVILSDQGKTGDGAPSLRFLQEPALKLSKGHRAQPLVQQLVFFEKRVTQSFAFR